MFIPKDAANSSIRGFLSVPDAFLMYAICLNISSLLLHAPIDALSLGLFILEVAVSPYLSSMVFLLYSVALQPHDTRFPLNKWYAPEVVILPQLHLHSHPDLLSLPITVKSPNFLPIKSNSRLQPQFVDLPEIKLYAATSFTVPHSHLHVKYLFLSDKPNTTHSPYFLPIISFILALL